MCSSNSYCFCVFSAAEDLREGLEALKASTEALKKRVSTGLDERLFYFSRLMPSSSGKHTAAATTIWDKYDECVVCGRKREFDASGRATVTLAHIVPGNSLISYKAFGRPRYRDDLNIKSIRNFLPLCGTEGLAESCHNEFDKYLLTILYDPFLKVFKALSLNALWSKHDACNGKTLRLSHTPYRRLLAWRTRHCFQVNSFLLNGISDIDALISAANFSEESHSIAGDDAAGTIDTSSAITKVSGSV